MERKVKLEKPIVVKLEGYKRSFRSLEKLDGFLNELIQFYYDFKYLSVLANDLNQSVFQELRKHKISKIDDLFHSDTDVVEKEVSVELSSIINGFFYPNGCLFYPESPFAKALKETELSQHYLSNAFILGLLGGQSQNYSGFHDFIQRLESTYYGDNDSVDMINSFLEGIVKREKINREISIEAEIENRTGIFYQDLLELHDEQNDEILGTRGRIVRLLREFQHKDIPEHKRQLNHLLDNAKKDVDATIANFREHIANKEAVVYWRKKQNEAKNSVYKLILTSTIALLLTFWAESIVIQSYFEAGSSLNKLITGEDISEGLKAFMILMGVTITALPGIWIARYCMATASARTKYAQFSENKAMQIQTYLAMKQNNQIEGDQEKIIIEKIFSDHIDGNATSSDLPSISGMALMMKAIQGKQN